MLLSLIWRYTGVFSVHVIYDPLQLTIAIVLVNTTAMLSGRKVRLAITCTHQLVSPAAVRRQQAPARIASSLPNHRLYIWQSLLPRQSPRTLDPIAASFRLTIKTPSPELRIVSLRFCVNDRRTHSCGDKSNVYLLFVNVMHAVVVCMPSICQP